MTVYHDRGPLVIVVTVNATSVPSGDEVLTVNNRHCG